MSCNGCRVLRKGCSESCILRHCLQWIASPESQGHATVFVAKFFGRAGLMSFISAVPHSHRPALFQSLLFEACGRTVNPVNGAVGLLWTGNWSVCQAAVETVLRGGALSPMPELLASAPASDIWSLNDPISSSSSPKRKRELEDAKVKPEDLDLCLISSFPLKTEIRRPETPSLNSEESETTTTCFQSALGDQRKLLNLFV